MDDPRLLVGAVALFAGAAVLSWAAPVPMASPFDDPPRTLAVLVGAVLFVWGGATMVRWADL